MDSKAELDTEAEGVLRADAENDLLEDTEGVFVGLLLGDLVGTWEKLLEDETDTDREGEPDVEKLPVPRPDREDETELDADLLTAAERLTEGEVEGLGEIPPVREDVGDRVATEAVLLTEGDFEGLGDEEPPFDGCADWLADLHPEFEGETEADLDTAAEFVELLDAEGHVDGDRDTVGSPLEEPDFDEEGEPLGERVNAREKEELGEKEGAALSEACWEAEVVGRTLRLTEKVGDEEGGTVRVALTLEEAVIVAVAFAVALLTVEGEAELTPDPEALDTGDCVAVAHPVVLTVEVPVPVEVAHPDAVPEAVLVPVPDAESVNRAEMVAEAV